MTSEHSQEGVATATTTSGAPGDPYIIGITGTRGSGKSTVGEILRTAGVPVIDADKLAHEFLNGPCEVYDQVLARFGDDLVHSEGGPIDRAKLSEIIESDAQAKCDLEAIMHPSMFQLMAERMESLAGHPVIALEMPLLHEKGKKEVFDKVWCVVAREDILLERLMARNNISEERARQQLAMQLSQVEKSALSDLTISNHGTVDELEATVLEHLAEARAEAENASSEDDSSEPNPDDTSEDADSDDSGNDDSGECGPVEPNEHYRERLREFAHIGTEAALSRMGPVHTTGHKTAKATMRMEVGSDNGDGSTDPSRELEVSVEMSIRNANAGGGEGCSCGCSTDCKVSCACAEDCGCSCKKPEPTPTPCPQPPEKDGWNKNVVLICLTVLGVVFMIVLAFLLASGAKSHDHTVSAPGVVKVEVINTPSCLPECKPKPDTTVVVKAEPPVDRLVERKDDPVTACATAGSFRKVAEMPGYSFRFTLNAVKPRIATWYEKQLADCSGWVVEGREADGRMVVHQVFDANYWLNYQMVFTYYKDRSVQIDRYDGVLNTFVGRSILHVDQYGNVNRARLLDGLQRPVLEVDMSLTSSGHVYNLTYTRLNAETGVVEETKTISGQSEADAYLTGKFYGYDWFAKR